MRQTLNRNMSIENPNIPIGEALKDLLRGIESSAGTVVTRDTTLGLPAFWRGLNLISNNVARLPLDCFRRARNGSRTKDTIHAGHLAIQRPSPYIGPFQFRRTMTAHAIQFGNGYAEIIRDQFAEPSELYIHDPELVTPFKENGRLKYHTRQDGISRFILAENMLHIKGLGFDGLTGHSLLDVMLDTLGHSMALRKYGSVYFKNMAAPGVIIQLPVGSTFASEDDWKQFKAEWESNHKGLDRAHSVTVIENGATVAKGQIDNDAAQFLQSQEFELKSIANAIGLSPSKLGANYNTSYGSLEHEHKAFLFDLEPWLIAWEEECALKLLSETEKAADTHYFEHNRKALERSDSKTEVDLFTTQLNNGLLTVNQIMEAMNLPGIGPEGDKHRIPVNLTTIEDLAEAKEKAEQDAAEQPDEQTEETPDDPDQGDEQPDEQEETPDDPDEQPEAKLEKQLTHDAGRILNRLRKAFLARRKASYFHVREEMDTHREVACEALPTVAEAKVQHWLDSLADELDAVTREQYEAVFDSQDAAKIARYLTA